MKRDDIILVITKLADGVRPVERFMLMSQLRAACRRGSSSKLKHPYSWSKLIGQRKGASKVGRIRQECSACRYSLSGLDSVRFDDLSVGPVVCPECGQDYPAVSE